MQAITARCHLRLRHGDPVAPEAAGSHHRPRQARGRRRSASSGSCRSAPATGRCPRRWCATGSRGMTDTDFPSISIINLGSHREVEAQLGRPISPGRWRANLILDGLAPWAERDWVGKRIRVGLAELEVRENIVRCLATSTSVSHRRARCRHARRAGRRLGPPGIRRLRGGDQDRRHQPGRPGRGHRVTTPLPFPLAEPPSDDARARPGGCCSPARPSFSKASSRWTGCRRPTGSRSASPAARTSANPP